MTHMKLINTRMGLAPRFLQLTIDLRILSMQMTRYYSPEPGYRYIASCTPSRLIR